MEHLNYACHPQEFFTKIVSFAVVFAVVRIASHDGSVWAWVTTLAYGRDGMWVCNIMPFRRWVYRSVLRTSVRDWDYFLSVFRRYEAYASRPTMIMYNMTVDIIVCVFNSAAGNGW